MIEFGHGLTDKQVRELFQETTALLTMLTHPDVHDDVELRRQADSTFALSPTYALVVLASIGAARSRHLAGQGFALVHGCSVDRFPREVLQTVPHEGRPDLLLLAIDLVETVAGSGRARDVLDQLLVGGVQSYRVLLGVVHELGWLAARSDPTVRNLVELVALEAATAETNWYASGDAL